MLHDSFSTACVMGLGLFMLAASDGQEVLCKGLWLVGTEEVLLRAVACQSSTWQAAVVFEMRIMLAGKAALSCKH